MRRSSSLPTYGDEMIFCARSMGNGDNKPRTCERRRHIDPRSYALHGSEPKCLECDRVIAITYCLKGDSMFSLEYDRIVTPDDLAELHRQKDCLDGWPPIDE